MGVKYTEPGTGTVFKTRTDTGEEVQAVDLEASAIVGATNETAAASDTATAGLNGRLQRIAQRLTSVIGLLPTALGAQGGLKVEGIASGTAVPISAASLPSHPVTNAGTFPVQAVSAGDVAHDGGDAGNPVKIGAKAIAHGSNPAAVAAGDRTDLYANRHGIPFQIGGHPAVITLKHTTITTAVTDAAIVASISAGTKVVVTRITATLDNASTVFPTVLIGFGATNTPTTTGVLVAHGGVPAGGGFTVGDGSGILGVGGDGEELRVTTTGNATGNGLQITVSYYLIES